jgi:hypothetical protein
MRLVGFQELTVGWKETGTLTAISGKGPEFLLPLHTQSFFHAGLWYRHEQWVPKTQSHSPCEGDRYSQPASGGQAISLVTG